MLKHRPISVEPRALSAPSAAIVAGAADLYLADFASERAKLQAEIQLYAKLRKLVTAGDRPSARALFDTAMESRVANMSHLNLMQRLFDTTAEKRSMLQEMVQAGVKPTVGAYTTLVQQLMFEGNSEEARTVAEQEMPAARVGKNHNQHRKGTRMLLDRPIEQWSKMRTRLLQQLLQTGTPEATMQAKAFFEQLKANGAANEFHYSVMQRLCDDSAAHRKLMAEMDEAGIKPTVFVYTMLVSQLLMEGKLTEALVVTDTEMSAAGLAPGERMHALFERPAEIWSKQRTRRLQQLLQIGTPKATRQAEALFEQLKASGMTDVFHWSVMQRLCDDSDEHRTLMEEMTEAGVKPDVATYTMLVNQLKHDGLSGAAQAVLNIEMPAAGIVPDDRMRALFDEGGVSSTND